MLGAETQLSPILEREQTEKGGVCRDHEIAKSDLVHTLTVATLVKSR
jgi:hypothetical protein